MCPVGSPRAKTHPFSNPTPQCVSCSGETTGLTLVTGVCVRPADCTADGGTTIDGACPWDGSGIKCCSKPTCRNGADGNCRWVSDCADSSVSGQCPGPSAFKCCSSKATGFGGYRAPDIPSIGACKRVAVDGAKKIVAAFPGRVREIGCVRPHCSCGPRGSDHCCGMATDMMCSDGGGVSSYMEDRM